ncbi:type II secretion system protein E [Ignisphaera aggregans DSM 17230]|uniref:Type II secretion system protein E n=1 Tax=Ignisphaera aggregans (strain DSM 17230 / JCM 13409 / AQ1.S1) TaxID=583356 RepID=E0SRU6_IGNAA|nr:type II secretion system protein E [Ignisphaera aggregans DSM 17230]
MSLSALEKIFSRFRKKSSESAKPQETVQESILEDMESIAKTERVTHKLYSIQRGYRVIESYPVAEPFAHINIVEEESTGRLFYEVYEISLSDEEKKIYDEIRDHIIWEIKPVASLDVDVAREIMKTARRVMREFQIRFTKTPGLSWSKIGYYIERDLIGFGVLEPIFRDRHIEDISCNGPGKPVYVWHRKYEYLPTNIVFVSSEELDEYILKLAHMAGKHISVAYPILDAILPGGHRLAATFRKEVSTAGSTFTIRKFSESPITIADMINYGTISSRIAAYFWLAMEYKMTTLILGVTGAGKTSTLNALATLLKPTYKIVTIEDTPELRIPSENWVQLVSRPSYVGSGVGEISLFQLVKLSLRYRPDVIIVGEVRGEEAYVLFQAIATGHSGMTTLHAESIDAAVKRLTSPPMNIPSSYIPLVNISMVIKRVQIRDERGRVRPGRRITNIWEVRDYEDYIEIAKWNPVEDRFEIDLSKSIVLQRISELTGMPMDSLLEEIETREKVLLWLVKTGRTDYRGVANTVYRYYINRQGLLKEIGLR